MKDLSIVVNNAIISGVRVKDKPNKNKLIISLNDNNVKDIRGNINICYGLRGIYPYSEIDILYVIEKERSIKVYSFELKSREGSWISRKLIAQLLRQSLFLTFVTLDGFYINLNNGCIFLVDKLRKKPVEIKVMYLNGYSERYVKEMPLQITFKTLYRYSQIFSYIYIYRNTREFYIDIEIALPHSIYRDNLSIPTNYLNIYREILIKNYKKIVDEIISNLKRENTEKSLSSILIGYEYSYLEALSWF